MAHVFIALGGNVGDVPATIASAIADIGRRPGFRLLARSANYRTPPWGNTDQPPFVNACIEIETTTEPRALLRLLHVVERAHGRDRKRERRWGPRTLDLDIIAYEGVTMHDDDLTLPHPRLFERAFVLVPMAEIAPHLVVAGRRIAEAAASSDRTGIERLNHAPPGSERAGKA